MAPPAESQSNAVVYVLLAGMCDKISVFALMFHLILTASRCKKLMQHHSLHHEQFVHAQHRIQVCTCKFGSVCSFEEVTNLWLMSVKTYVELVIYSVTNEQLRDLAKLMMVRNYLLKWGIFWNWSSSKSSWLFAVPLYMPSELSWKSVLNFCG